MTISACADWKKANIDHMMHIINQQETILTLVLRTMVEYLDVAQEFHEVVTNDANGLSIVFFCPLIFTIIILFRSITYIIDITLTNKFINSRSFTNIAVTKINDIINARILSYGTVLGISTSIMILLIVFDISFIVETSKHTKEMVQQQKIQLKSEAYFQNFPNNNNHDDIDTINYNINTIDSLKQIYSIIIFFMYFGMILEMMGLKKKMKLNLNFKIKMSIVVILLMELLQLILLIVYLFLVHYHQQHHL